MGVPPHQSPTVSHHNPSDCDVDSLPDGQTDEPVGFIALVTASPRGEAFNFQAFPLRGRWPAGPDEVSMISQENVKNILFVYDNAFQREQEALALQAPGVARQASVRADDAVAGHDERYGVAAHRAAHGPGRAAGQAQARGDLAVGRGLPAGDLRKLGPDRPFKRRAPQVQRRLEIRVAAGEVGIQPAGGLRQYGQVASFTGRAEAPGEVPLPLEPEADERRAVRGQQDRPQRGDVAGDMVQVSRSCCPPERPRSCPPPCRRSSGRSRARRGTCRTRRRR